MAYTGTRINIPLGQLGLLTDDTASALPVNSLSKANNIDFHAGRLGKFRGDTKFTTVALGQKLVKLYDWWPNPGDQRLIALTDDGSVWRDTGGGDFNTQTALTTVSGFSTDSCMVTGGSEGTNLAKKLFILDDQQMAKVLRGDDTNVYDVALPPTDWHSGYYPTFGVLYQNRMIMMGSSCNPHLLYCSTISDHENFVGQTIPTYRWNFGQRVAATPNVDKTADIQAGTATTIFTLVNNDGYLVYAVKPFNKITFVISQAASGGSPVYTYEYWNGSAWTALTLTTTPDYSSTGTTSAEFVAPSDWVIGDSTEALNSDYYALRVLATTAPSGTTCKATSLVVQNTAFDTTPDTFSIYPGEGEKIKCAVEYRGLLFIFKEPYGVYILDGRNPDSANWTLAKYSDAFGVSSPHAALQILGDLIVANSIGSYTSLKASDAFGDFEAGDILANNKVEDYIRGELSFDGVPYTQSIYYPEKKIAMWTAWDASGVANRLLCIDVASSNPRISLCTKAQITCLGMRKDSQGILRPIYGDDAGDVYLMDQATYNVDGVAYLAEFQTNDSDLGQVDSQLAGKNKIFDFLEVSYIPTGNNSFYVDVYVDGELRCTKEFEAYLGVGLDSFVLDTDELLGTVGTRRNRLPLQSCTGNKISLRFYNNGNNEGFIVERAILDFRMSSDQVYAEQVGV